VTVLIELVSLQATPLLSWVLRDNASTTSNGATGRHASVRSS